MPSSNLTPLTAIKLQHYTVFLQSVIYNTEYSLPKENPNENTLTRLPCKSDGPASGGIKPLGMVSTFLCRRKVDGDRDGNGGSGAKVGGYKRFYGENR